MLFSKNRRGVFVLLSVGCLVLSACSTHPSSSRYGGGDVSSCGQAVSVPCPPVLSYVPIAPRVIAQPVIAPPQVNVQPVPCTASSCLPEPVYEAPIVEAPIYEPPVIDPPIYDPPAYPSYEDPQLYIPPASSCPDGYISSYGGDDCIPIAVPRK